MTEPLPVGSTIGILGGGQLGRMLSVAASRLGLRCHIFEPGADSPASHVADHVTTASYDDAEALAAFAKSVDVITYEFENVPAEALDALEAFAPIRPGRNALATSQDRMVEKQFLSDLGLGVAPFAAVDHQNPLTAAVASIGMPSILKTRRFGYDGKGQARISATSDLGVALETMGNAPAILEGFVPFDLEISVIAARSTSGEIACFTPGKNEHGDGILRITTVPAPVADAVNRGAFDIATRILEALDYVGVLGVELFVVGDELLVNEIAPRVHNSGHWTQDGCVVDQFEQHIRAIAGWPLGQPSRHSNVVMHNLIGDEIDNVPTLATEPDVGIHVYGKSETKPGRKMGHINRLLRSTVY